MGYRIHYAVREGMLRAAGKSERFCHACFSGQYAIPFTPTSRRQMRLVGV